MAWEVDEDQRMEAAIEAALPVGGAAVALAGAVLI
jgi:hypothetical protein